MGEQSAHAILSPSSAKRWMTCTPSARFEQQFPSSTSVFAEEGTLAHQISEYLLKVRLGMQPKDDNWLELVKINPLYSAEMLTHCEQYADYCMSKVHKDSLVDVESRLEFEQWVPEGFGTGDFMSYTRSLKLLEFTDLKYGKGVPVSAKDNPQLKIYALGAYAWYKWVYGDEVDIETIKVNIYQPRLGDPSEWEISLVDLLKWADTELRPAALLAFAGEGEYVAGNHCGFCKGRFTCVTRAEYMMKLAEHDLKAGNMLTDAELADIIIRGEQLVGWLTDVKDHVTGEILKGKSFAGLKLVEGRSNRIYANEFHTIDTLRKAGIKDAEIFTQPELLGVTKLKTSIGAKVFKELVEPDLRKPPGKPTLVGEDDPRPDFDRASAVFRDAELRESLAAEE